MSRIMIAILALIGGMLLTGCNDNIDIQDHSINIYNNAQLAEISRKIKVGEDLSTEEQIIWQEYQDKSNNEDE